MDQSSSHFHSQEQEGGKFIIDSADGWAERTETLPESYGANCLVILTRDPFWFFAYWEITAERINAVSREHGASIWENSQTVLRVYDVTNIDFNGSNAHRFFDIGIILETRQWYVRVDQSGRAYCAELGLKLPDGRFISLLRSNFISLPAGHVSDLTDSQWMAIQQDETWHKLLQVSGIENIGRGSGEASKVMAQRWEFLRSVFSGSSSKLSSSWSSPITAEEGKKG